MSDTDNERPLAPGIANAMRNVRNAGALTSPAHRRRWNLPSDHNDAPPESAADER